MTKFPIVAWAVAIPLSLALIGPLSAADIKPIDLKVLYAGNLESDRTEDFESFLKQHFREVATTDYSSFRAEQADRFDVVIFDWSSIYPRTADGKIDMKSGSISSPKAPAIDRSFSRPAILIGAAGGSIANRLNIAINWK
jgi:hypothetical protein